MFTIYLFVRFLKKKKTHYLVSFFFFFFIRLFGMRDVSSLTRDQTHSPYIGSAEP